MSHLAEVVLSSIGYEYWSTHRALGTLAERMAQNGHHVMRFDYDGTGDSSAGDRWDPVGPGRVWVDYARAIAVAEYMLLHLDWSGW